MNRRAQFITRLSAPLVPVTILSVALLGGCGGAGGGSKNLTDGDGYVVGRSKTTGGITLAIKWPVRTTSLTRVIPTATTGIQLVVTSQSGIFTSTGTNTYVVPTIPYGTATYTIANVPAGTASIVASALLQQPSGTIVLANVAPTTVAVVAQQTAALNLTLTATLTTSTTAVTATIQKVLNPDGSAVSPADPAGVPQTLTNSSFYLPFNALQDQAVYEVVATIAGTTPGGGTTPLPLPTASEFNFDIENDYDLTGTASAFLTAVDATGKPLAIRPAIGNVAYFKVSLAGTNGEIYIPLNATLFSDPNSNVAPYAVYYLAAPGFTP